MRVELPVASAVFTLSSHLFELPSSAGKRLTPSSPYRVPMLIPALLFPLLFAALAVCLPALAAAMPQAISPSVETLAVFFDRSMSDAQWQSLAISLDRRLAAPSPEFTALSTQKFQLLRGDRIQPGIEVHSIISVYLHGSCTLPARANVGQHIVRGALGWVNRSHGQIEPFVHVDCALLGELLVHRIAFLSAEEQDLAMPTALAEIILHEWIHIATQSASHSKHGISKAEFTADDLLSPIPVTVSRTRRRGQSFEFAETRPWIAQANRFLRPN